MRGRLVGGLCALAATLAVPGSAAAAEGQLTYGGCLANDAADGCVDLPSMPLREARAVAVSPDGGSVYVGSARAGSVSHFLRAPQGQLSYEGCLSDDGFNGCVDLPSMPLTDPSSVAVSPDGGSVYVASGTASSVAHFLRAPQGPLTYDGCLADDASGGCVDLPNTPLTGASSVAVSPDGGSVYVTGSSSISHFLRAPQGQLTYDGCLADDAADGCIDLPDTPLTGASSVAVSPDGRSVYVVSGAANSVAHFVRDPQGQLTYDGCLADDTTHGCTGLPNSPLTGARAVTVSPDGGSVYVVSGGANSVAHFFRAPDGGLTYDGCLADDATHGCTDLPNTPLTGAAAVAVSPDGGSVYVASFEANSVAHFFREVPTSTSTTTTTLPVACSPGATFTSLACRLQALIDRVGDATGLGAMKSKLLGALGDAKTREEQAAASCKAADAKRSRRGLRQASRRMTQYGRQLRSKRARKTIEDMVRKSLLADGDTIRTDLKALRSALACPQGG